MRIGQLSAATDTPTSTLRYYERAGLLPPPARTGAGYRDYPDDAVGRIAFIRNAQAAGLTLAQVGEVLAIAMTADQRVATSPMSSTTASPTSTAASPSRAELREVRRRLDGLAPADCSPTDACSTIPSAG